MVASASRRAEKAGERVDCLEQRGIDAGLLFSGAADAEFGDRAAVLGLGGELANPGGNCRVAQGGPGVSRPWAAGRRRLA